jgi:phage shock protein PspC (stress-responsive transcriptional regulator)
VIFVITIFFGGLGIVAYIVMVIIVPNEDSKAGKDINKT